jgi:hypothetical protein
MEISPYYLLVGVGAGFVFVTLLQNLRLALQSLLMVGKVAIIAFLVLLIVWTLGLWRPTGSAAVLVSALRQLWQPMQRAVLEWIPVSLR